MHTPGIRLFALLIFLTLYPPLSFSLSLCPLSLFFFENMIFLNSCLCLRARLRFVTYRCTCFFYFFVCVEFYPRGLFFTHCHSRSVLFFPPSPPPLSRCMLIQFSFFSSFHFPFFGTHPLAPVLLHLFIARRLPYIYIRHSPLSFSRQVFPLCLLSRTSVFIVSPQLPQSPRYTPQLLRRDGFSFSACHTCIRRA